MPVIRSSPSQLRRYRRPDPTRRIPTQRNWCHEQVEQQAVLWIPPPPPPGPRTPLAELPCPYTAQVLALRPGVSVSGYGSGSAAARPISSSTNRNSTVSVRLAAEALDSLAATRGESVDARVFLPSGLRVGVPQSPTPTSSSTPTAAPTVALESTPVAAPAPAPAPTPASAPAQAPAPAPHTAHKIPRKPVPPPGLAPPPRLVLSPDECPLTHRPLTAVARDMYNNNNNTPAPPMIGPAPAPVTGATCVPYVAYTPYKAYHPSMAPSVSSLLFPPQRTHKQPRATVVRSDASSGSGTLGSGSGSGSGSEGSSSSGLEERLARCAVAERDAAETPARGFGGVKAGGSSAVSLVSGASFSSDVGASIAGTDTPTSTTSMYIPTPTTASSMSRPLPPLPSLPLSRWERTKGATKRLAEKLGDTDVMFPPPTD